MIYIYIEEEDIYKFHKLLKLDAQFESDIILYYHINQKINTVMVSLGIDVFTRLSDMGFINKVVLLNN